VDLPNGYAKVLAGLKERIARVRLRVVVAANTSMVQLYWEIGRVILGRQAKQGWGAKVIDRLAVDLRVAFPDMRGFSPRNLLFMRGFAESYPDEAIVKQLVSQLPWGHTVRLLQRVKDPKARDWYARRTIEDAWTPGSVAITSSARLRSTVKASTRSRLATHQSRSRRPWR
jgi:predicted nuclease of restriction endonuclease-like (RecB) superfamily